MIDTLNTSSNRFLEALQLINARLERAQREVGSGKRLITPSDAPDSVSSLLQVRADVARLEQVAANLNRTRAEADTAEQALQSAVKLFDRVRTLGMTGASSVQTPETRQGIADELQSILERFVGIANSQVDGRYIFSGDSDQVPAFQLDTSTPTGVSPYMGVAATREAIHPTGVTLKVSLSGDGIFDNADPDKNVFGIISTLRAAILSGDEAAMNAALAPLPKTSAHLNSGLTFYGNVQNQMLEAVDTTARLKTQLGTERSELEDADATAAIVELEQLRFQQEAALRMRSSMPRSNLFDYLR